MNWDRYEKPRVRFKRPARKRILVVTEGIVTEPHYFEKLKAFLELKKYQLEVHVECGPDHDGNTPSCVVSSALKLREEAEARQRAKDKTGDLEARESYDEVWVVFDTERDGKNKDLKNAAVRAQQKKLKVAISRPSFESWFLLHLRVGLPAMATSNDACKEISKITKKAHGREYHKKSKQNVDLQWLIEIILDSTKDAVARSSQIAKTAFATHKLVPDHSGTRVHELVQSLLQASPMWSRTR